MTEIGVERLATGHGEEDGAKRCKPNPSMSGQEHDAMGRIEGGEHAGVLGDVRKPTDGKGNEPDKRDRSEEGGDPCRAVRLHREQREQNQKGKGDDVSLEGWRGDGKSFHRRQHRDCRRDQSVAVEQCGADDAESDNNQASAPEGPIGERHQCQRAAFAVAVGAEQDQDVFHGDDEDQRRG